MDLNTIRKMTDQERTAELRKNVAGAGSTWRFQHVTGQLDNPEDERRDIAELRPCNQKMEKLLPVKGRRIKLHRKQNSRKTRTGRQLLWLTRWIRQLLLLQRIHSTSLFTVRLLRELRSSRSLVRRVNYRVAVIDRAKIMETKASSKDKRWRLVETAEKAK